MKNSSKVSPSSFRRRKSVTPKQLAAFKSALRRVDRAWSDVIAGEIAAARMLSLRGLVEDRELRRVVSNLGRCMTNVDTALRALGISVRYPSKPRRGSRVKGRRGAR